MADQIADLRNSLEKQASEATSAFAPHACHNTLVNGAYETVCSANRELRTLANTTALKLRELEANDLLPEAGKARLLAETRSEAKERYQELHRKLNGALAVLETAAFTAALPPVPRDREAAARDEALMRMLGTNDPVRALEEVASLGGEMSAVAASSWGESYLRAKGLSPAEAKRMHREVVQLVAVHAATNSADQRQAAQAKAYFALPAVRKAATIHLNLASDDLKAAGVI